MDRRWTLILIFSLPLLCGWPSMVGESVPDPAGSSIPTYIESTAIATNVGGASVSVAYPASSAAGDYVVCIGAVDGNNREQTIQDDQLIPQAFTREGYVTGGSKSCAVFYRQIQPGDSISGSNIIMTPASDDTVLQCALVRNATTAVTATTFSDGDVTPTSTVQFSSITTTNPNSVVIVGSCNDGNDNWAADPSTYTQIGTGDVTSVAIGWAYKEITSSGSQSPGNATLSGTTDYHSFTFALE